MVGTVRIRILFWGAVIALILFFMSMLDSRMITEQNDLIICQFGYSKTEFIMTAKTCRDDGGSIYYLK